MRGRTLFGLIVILLLLSGYAAYWFIAAGRIEEEITAQAASLRRQNLDAAWKTIRVGGFPFAFDVRFGDARLRSTAAGSEIRAPSLSASARPWNFQDWRLSAPDGLSARLGGENDPLWKVAAQSATGAVAVGNAATIWLALTEASAELPEHVTAAAANLWAILPDKDPQVHTDRSFAIAADLHTLNIPLVPAPFNIPIDDAAFGATVMGELPAGPVRQAAAAWRDAGGTVELDNFALRWGQLGIGGSGTLALGPDLQPIGAFSGAVSGYNQLLDALSAQGRLRMGDLTIARIGLAALAKPGPGGKPEISTSFTIQNGEMFLGPLKLGPAPRIDW